MGFVKGEAFLALIAFVAALVFFRVVINVGSKQWQDLLKGCRGNKIVAGVIAALIVFVFIPTLWWASGDWSASVVESEWVPLLSLPAGGKAVIESPTRITVRVVWATGQNIVRGTVFSYTGSSFPMKISVRRSADLSRITVTR